MKYFEEGNISIVIPVYNEEQNIKPLYSKLKKAIENWNIKDYEIIFIDDGSTDKTYDELTLIKNEKVNLIKLKNNAGKTNALMLGIKNAKHDIIVTLDGDMQNDPEDIKGMLKKLNQGYDCVCGWRFNRDDPFIRKASSRIANFVRKSVLKDNFHDVGCGMIMFKKSCIKSLLFFEGAHRFFPILIKDGDNRTVEYKIKHYPRKFGKAKYNVRNRIFKSLNDLIYIKRVLKKK